MRPSGRRAIHLTGAALLLLASGMGIGAFMVERWRDAGALPARASLEPPAQRAPSASPERNEDGGWVGVVLARATVDVAAKLEGRLETVHVKLGDHVTRGAPIATLDPKSFRQELEMAEAALRAAQAEQRKADVQLNEAHKRLARSEALGRLVSEQDLAGAEVGEKLAVTALEVARAHVDQETARVGQLQETLANAEIRAPFDGTIAARYQDPGAMLRSGTPIVRLIRSDDLLVRFAVPEVDLAGIAIGRVIKADIQSLGIAVPAVVQQIAPEVDAASQMVVVEAGLSVPPGLKSEIQSGLVCRVSRSPASPQDSQTAH